MSLQLRFPATPLEVTTVTGTLCSSLVWDYMSYKMSQYYGVKITPVEERVLDDYKIGAGLRTEVMGLTEPICVGMSEDTVRFIVFNSTQYYVAVGSLTATRNEQWIEILDSE